MPLSPVFLCSWPWIQCHMFLLGSENLSVNVTCTNSCLIFSVMRPSSTTQLWFYRYHVPSLVLASVVCFGAIHGYVTVMWSVLRCTTNSEYITNVINLERCNVIVCSYGGFQYGMAHTLLYFFSSANESNSFNDLLKIIKYYGFWVIHQLLSPNPQVYIWPTY